MRFSALSIILVTSVAYGQATLPAGHPAIPGMQPALPSGHPDISGLKPATQPSSHGAIALRIVQGTTGATAIKGEPFVVELYYQGKVIRKVDGKVDDKSVAVLDGLPLALPFQPMARMIRGGVEYTVTGELMDSQHPDQQMDLTVYESTEEVPALQIQMFHVMATPTPEGLRVMQMLAIQNPGDRTWVGKADAKGRRVTLSLPVPPGAKEVVVSGLLEEGSALTEDWKLISTQPLQPGMGQAQVTYLVPGKDGQANIKVTTPAPVKNMILFLPDDGSAAKVDGLESAGIRESGDAKSRMFRGAELKAGHEVVLSITLPMASVPQNVAASNVPKIIAGVGVALIVVIGAIVVVLKTPKAKKR